MSRLWGLNVALLTGRTRRVSPTDGTKGVSKSILTCDTMPIAPHRICFSLLRPSGNLCAQLMDAYHPPPLHPPVVLVHTPRVLDPSPVFAISLAVASIPLLQVPAMRFSLAGRLLELAKVLSNSMVVVTAYVRASSMPGFQEWPESGGARLLVSCASTSLNPKSCLPYICAFLAPPPFRLQLPPHPPPLEVAILKSS